MSELKDNAKTIQTLLKLSEAGTLWVRLEDAEKAVRAARLQALQDAADDTCDTCRRVGPPSERANGEWYHTTLRCDAQEIHERIKREGL